MLCGIKIHATSLTTKIAFLPHLSIEFWNFILMRFLNYWHCIIFCFCQSSKRRVWTSFIKTAILLWDSHLITCSMQVTCRLLGVILEESVPEELQVVKCFFIEICAFNSYMQRINFICFVKGRNKLLWGPPCWKCYWR